MKITSVEVKVLEKRQRLCGSAAIVLDDCFKVRDILILEKESTGELHISMPSKKLGKNYFVALVHPITSEFRHEIEDLVLSEYQRLIEAGETESPKYDSGEAKQPTVKPEKPDEPESPTEEKTIGEEDDV